MPLYECPRCGAAVLDVERIDRDTARLIPCGHEVPIPTEE